MSATHVASGAVPFCPQCATEYEGGARFCGHCGTSLPEPTGESPEDPWQGKIVDRRYRVLEKLGSGGMGLVYKVEHIQLDKVAAMKVLHTEMARDADAVRRFRVEAQAVSRLDHPNIVQTFDFGRWEDSLYLVMEYLKGEDLAALVKREGPLPFERAARLFVQICSALTEAHDAGIIHRDLKPENIVVVRRRDGTETAKVLDFGLAKLRERSEHLGVTSGNQVLGTPYYMSPEQVRSEPLDVRTDIYSLGATLYRVLTGTPPFQATTPVGVLTKHITDPLELPRTRAPELNLPPMADAIVLRAMAKARTDRYPTAADVQRDLEAALAQNGILPDPRHALANAPTLSSRPPPSEVLQDDHDRRETTSDPEGTSGAERLRRQEFDAYERSLHRRRRLAGIGIPVVLLAGAGLIVGGLARTRERASMREREPNDTPAQATLLPLDRPVEGYVGKRLSEGAPDLDYFHLPLSKASRAISARLAGIPGVDLVLELYDGQGKSVGKSDAHGKGGGEWLQPTVVGPGEAFLLVRQLWTQGAPPVEEIADPYRLSVHFGAPQTGWEVEPNDVPVEASPLTSPSRRARGFLASAEDRDWYSLASLSPGSYVAHVEAPVGVDAVLLLAEAARGEAPEEPAVKVHDRAERQIQIRVGKDYFLGVARKQTASKPGKESKAGREAKNAAEPPDTKDQGLAGLDDPYELTIEAVRE